MGTIQLKRNEIKKTTRQIDSSDKKRKENKTKPNDSTEKLATATVTTTSTYTLEKFSPA